MNPDNPATALVKTAQSPALARVSNQLALTDKLLTKPEEPFLIPYRKGDKWGFCDRDKNIVIDCVWDEISAFQEGIAILHSFSWGNYYSRDDYDEFLYINDCGVTIYEQVLTGFFCCLGTGFTEGFSLITISHHNGEPPTSIVIDKNGRELVNSGEYYSVISTFKEGMAIVNKYVYQSDGDTHGVEFFGFIDTKGRITVPCVYSKVEPFFQGVATVEKDKSGFLIDKQGSILSSFNF